jgi:hypothetical protein
MQCLWPLIVRERPHLDDHKACGYTSAALNGESITEFHACTACKQSWCRSKLPPLYSANHFAYPPKPHGLPTLDPTTVSLVSPRLPFMHIRCLCHEGSCEIVGHVLNMPMDVSEMVKQLQLKLFNILSWTWLWCTTTERYRNRVSVLASASAVYHHCPNTNILRIRRSFVPSHSQLERDSLNAHAPGIEIWHSSPALWLPGPI